MKKIVQIFLIMVFPCVALIGEKTTSDPIDSFFKEGKITLNGRLRYEFAENGGVQIDDGFSARIRYGFVSGSYSGFKIGLEGETLESLGDDADINGLDAAGEGTELNQAWASYTLKDSFSVKAGRQIFALLDHRFIGHVGWRQNIQTFDAIALNVTPVENLTLDAFYLDKVNRVNGAYNDMETFGLQTSYKFSELLNATAFYYQIEVEAAAGSLGAAASNDTLGLRLTGSTKVGETELIYAVSFATQEDNGGSPLAFDADYWAAEVKAKISGFTIGGGFELMGDGFRTPLSTVHKFAGFADVFAGPSLAGGLTDGLYDYYLLASYKIPVGKGIVLNAAYHQFETSSSGDLGTEIDLVVAYKLNKYVSFVAKYANYSADDTPAPVAYGGVDKELFTLEVNFVY